MSQQRTRRTIQRLRFHGSSAYWERRYSRGGTSGAGSYGAQARYKAEFLNAFVAQHGVSSVVEFGCGDGNQLSLASYPRYVGLDVSEAAIDQCLKRFASDKTKSFFAYRPSRFSDPARFIHGDVVLSLDVIYHLVEDEVFDNYMRDLVNAADRFIVIYAKDESGPRQAAHVRHRQFKEWMQANEPSWELVQLRRRTSDAYQDFFVFAQSAGVARNLEHGLGG